MNQSVKYVGLNVHKDTIAVAAAEGDGRPEARENVEIVNTPAALTKLLGKLGGPGIYTSSVAAYKGEPTRVAYAIAKAGNWRLRVTSLRVTALLEFARTPLRQAR